MFGKQQSAQCGGCATGAHKPGAVDNGPSVFFFAALCGVTFAAAFAIYRAYLLAGAFLGWAIVFAPCCFAGLLVFRLVERRVLMGRVHSGDVERKRSGRVGVVHERRNGHVPNGSHLPIGEGVSAGPASAPREIDDGPLDDFDVIDVESWEEETV